MAPNAQKRTSLRALYYTPGRDPQHISVPVRHYFSGEGRSVPSSRTWFDRPGRVRIRKGVASIYQSGVEVCFRIDFICYPLASGETTFEIIAYLMGLHSDFLVNLRTGDGAIATTAIEKFLWENDM
ncbi:hypothetical protein NLI96_g12059 [Meripilus lineatus]|uniref:Uncharacterized protein n=1 Tax=Meripilus lineatus TaxID=2056292 RepID=A0AAD5YCS1_9APHY|nr:hypothetical protein NLI96_g12059 [Physisporinus lineatus]